MCRLLMIAAYVGYELLGVPGAVAAATASFLRSFVLETIAGGSMFGILRAPPRITS